MFDICNRIGRLQESKYNVNKAKECRKRSHVDLKFISRFWQIYNEKVYLFVLPPPVIIDRKTDDNDTQSSHRFYRFADDCIDKNQ